MSRWGFWSALFLFIGLFMLPLQVLTQGESCPDVVKQALVELGNNCVDMSRNSACYGYNKVAAAFNQIMPDEFFTQPADRSELTTMQSIQTAPLDTALNVWGVAVLSAQANIPGTLPGQSARFILLGDVALDNDVPADEGSQSVVEPVTIKTRTQANIRSFASTTSNVVVSVDAATELLADGVSPDKIWLRVTYEGNVGWLRRDLIEATDGPENLPVIDSNHHTPMQAFHLRTGQGEGVCSEAPSMLVVQGPEHLKITITVDGVDIGIGSTIALSTSQNFLRLITVVGSAEVQGLTVPPGFIVDAPLSADGRTVVGPFGRLRILEQQELDGLQSLNQLPASVLNYSIQVPSMQEVQCSLFKPTSPLDGLAFGSNTFYWDRAYGVTDYLVTVFYGGTVKVPASQTNATLDLSGVGNQSPMTWNVEALNNGQVVCRSQSVTIPRSVSGGQSPGCPLSSTC